MNNGLVIALLIVTIISNVINFGIYFSGIGSIISIGAAGLFIGCISNFIGEDYDQGEKA